MTDVVNPKEASPDQLLPYHKKISVEGKALIICFISYTYMVLKRTQSIVFTYLRSLIFTFLSQIDVILWANMPILSGTSTTNYIPICLATSAAKSSLFFSRPSPVSKRMNFFTLMDAPLALATAATYWETLCLPSSAFT